MRATDAPTVAQLYCKHPHYWCQTCEVEVCSLARSIGVKHERCKLRPLAPKPEPAGKPTG